MNAFSVYYIHYSHPKQVVGKELKCALNAPPNASLNAVVPPATPVYTESPDSAVTPMDQNVTGNVLSNADVPPGQTATVLGFSVAGTNQVICPVPMGRHRSLQSTGGVVAPNCVDGPATLTDPTTGEPIGTLTMATDGTYTFDPAPGYVGPVPSVNVYTATSGGQTAISTLTLDIVPGRLDASTTGCTWPSHCMHMRS